MISVTRVGHCTRKPSMMRTGSIELQINGLSKAVSRIHDLSCHLGRGRSVLGRFAHVCVLDGLLEQLLEHVETLLQHLVHAAHPLAHHPITHHSATHHSSAFAFLVSLHCGRFLFSTFHAFFSHHAHLAAVVHHHHGHAHSFGLGLKEFDLL